MTTYGAGAELRRTLGRRASFLVSYDARYGERQIVNERNTEQAATAQLARNVGRETSLRVLYSVRQGEHRTPGGLRRNTEGQDLHLGLEHRWQHSTTRSTVLSVAGGPSLLRDRPSGPRAADSTGTLGAAGTIRLDQDVSQNWTVGLSYRRGAGVSGSQTFSNSAAVDVQGAAGRRVNLTVSAGYFDSEISLATVGDRYTTAFAGGTVHVAVTQFAAVYGQYAIYHYDLGTVALLSPGHLPRQTRRAISAGVTLWMPFLQK
jgi:hypothetical protein